MLVKIEKNIAGGYGLGRLDNGKKVLIKKTLAREVVDASIYQQKRDYLIGVAEKIVSKSPFRVAAPCKYFNQCGACDLQNCLYEHQLEIKDQIIQESLKKNKINLTAEKIIPASEKIFYYRNSIRFLLIEKDNGQISLARSGYPNKNNFVLVDKCLLQSEISNLIAQNTVKFLNTSAFDKKSFWQLKIREAKRTEEIMIEIITTSHELPSASKIIESLKIFPQIKSIYHTIAPNKSLRALHRRLIFGSPIIHEKIGSFKFQISPESFFQTNSEGVKKLYDTIKNFAEVKINDEIIDLYAGTGTIAIYLSTLAKTITAVELNPQAVRDAKDNAKINKISNVKFVCSDIDKIRLKKRLPIIIVDPPRAGLSKKLIFQLAKTNFDKLIYVSCNLSTFARDLRILQNNHIKAVKIQPIDMFPQTHHIELVAKLNKTAKIS